jgi:DNA primase
MFPILDGQDRTLGFGGRQLKKEDEPKYLNTSETPVFQKGSILYGLPFAVSSLGEGAVVVEGYMDVIALHQHGVKAAMATLGTALTAGHLKLLRRHTDRVILCYDADTAGQRATDRAAVLFIEEGLEGRVLTLPAGQDPDEFIGANGREAFAARLAEAPDLVEYRLRAALEGAGSQPGQRAAAIEQAIVPMLADIRDEVRRAATVRRVAEWWAGEAIGLQEDLERSLLHGVRAKLSAPARVAGERPSRRTTGPVARASREVQVERNVLAALLHYPERFGADDEALGAAMFTDPACRAVFVALESRLSGPAGDVIDSLDETGRALAADLLTESAPGEADTVQRWPQWLAEMRVNVLQHRVEALRAEGAAAADDTAAREELFRRIHLLEKEVEEARRRLIR